MGGAMSIDQKSAQTILDRHIQQSSSKCNINVLSKEKVDIHAVDTNIGTLNITNKVVANSVSCILRTTLDNTNINTLKSQQGATQIDVPGIFSALNFGNDSITQNNQQDIVNQTSQFINSSCQQDTTADTSISIVLARVIAGVINVVSNPSTTKGNCILENMAKNYSANLEENTQKAFQAKISGDVLILIIIVICICVFLVVGEKLLHGKKKRGGLFSSMLQGDDDAKQIAEIRAAENQGY